MSVDIDLLQRCDSLGDLPIDARQLITENAVLARVPGKTALFDCGDTCNSLALVVSGSVRVFTRSPAGREISLYRVNRDELCILTLSCLLGGDVYPAAGVTEDDVVAIVLPAPLFHRLVDEQRSFRTAVFHLFAQRLAGFMQLIDEITFRKLDRRLAAYLAQRAPELDESHQQIADELGSVREVVSRLLKQFEDRRWISISRRKIEVVDLETLKVYAADDG
ncbi:MAG: Crp/Fnr family transcriptional regulator [Gammaproteobacteria bacterium]|nr:Crp/Fnr family transcriptional regulator [Gammaproteobacteria bacterium]